MSEERPTSTRRQFAKGLGGAAGITSLAGCADALNGEENEPETTRREEPPEQNNTEQPINETEEQNEQEEQPEEQGLTWEKVLEEHQESKDRRADKELIEKARNGEKPGEDYGVLFEDEEAGPVTLTGKNGTATVLGGYSHGKEYFDIEHFRSLDPTDIEDFKTILNDAIMLKAHELTNTVGKGISGAGVDYGFTAESLIETEFPEINLDIILSGNEGHGFVYAFAEQHEGGYLPDINTKETGRIGEDPLEGLPGTDWLGDENFIQDMKKYEGDQSGAHGLLKSFYRPGSDIFVEWDLFVEMTKDVRKDAEKLYTKIKPAFATVGYQKAFTDQINEDYAVITGDLETIPSRNEYENFEQYREAFTDHIHTTNDLNEAGEMTTPD